MNNYINYFIHDISKIVDSLIKDSIIKNNFDKSIISVDYSSKSKQGDISSNIVMILNQFLLNKNFDLRNHLLNNIKKIHYIEDVKIAKIGFINITFKNDYLTELFSDVINNYSSYGQNNLGKKKKINIEFVSANPTGPIHIAHIRGAVFGDVLSNIYQKLDYEVTREYYVNDSGFQITILGNSLFKRYQEILGEKINLSEIEYPGDYLIDIAKKLFNLDGDKWIKLEKNRKEYFQNFAIKEILETIKNDLKKIDIIFDKFIHESTIIKKNKIEEIFKLLKQKNLLYEGILPKPKGEEIENWEPRNQLLFKSTNFDDDNDRPFKKSNGEWTYFANDSAYHYDKIHRNYSNLINIWGADHIGYIKRMKAIVEVMSNKKNFFDIQVCQIVRLLKNGKILKMSKREGNFVTLNTINNEVGKSALRYYMISTKNETPIDFNINKVIEKNKDNPVFYCQYAYARASSIINKARKIDKFKNFEVNKIDFNNNYISEYEREIILKIISWPYVLIQSADSKQPHKITNYLEDLSSQFHSFWNRGKSNDNLRLIDIKNPKKTISKLLWIESMRVVLKNAFLIIGIEAHENM